MKKNTVANRLINHLWQDDASGRSPQVFAVVGCANDRGLEPKINNSGLDHRCLYREVNHYALKRSAPHLVALKPEHSFTAELLAQGWGQSWAIFIADYEQASITELRHHFRRLGKALLPDGRSVIFRYYDPRVLRTLLPSCDVPQLEQLFPKQAHLLMESEGGHSLLRCRLDDNAYPLNIESAAIA